VPELPELEALVQTLDPLVGRSPIASTPKVHFAVGRTFDPPFTGMVGHRFTGARRRAKRLLFPLDDGTTLLVHLMSAGRLAFTEPGEKRPAQPVLLVELEDGSALSVTERATRKRMRVGLYEEPGVMAELDGLGPEPLDPAFDVAALKAVLARGGTLHALLRDQHAIAGIGRAYANEILHAARLSPFQPAERLDDEQVASLHRAMVQTLTEGIERFRAQGTRMVTGKPRDVYEVHGQAGEPCPRCHEPLKMIDFAEHTIVYCPTCQTGGKVYADRRLSRLLK
jgi:formamidopyrimidine-DNA glycosylase